jgi:hypothetical protein
MHKIILEKICFDYHHSFPILTPTKANAQTTKAQPKNPSEVKYSISALQGPLKASRSRMARKQ